MNEITIQNALATNDFRFRENDKLTIDFVNSLKIKDLFCFHCRDVAEYLGFKRADKHFREALQEFLKKYGLVYVISHNGLSKYTINNFFNAEKQIYDELDQKINPNRTNREVYEWIAKESGRTFDEVVQTAINNRRKYSGTVEIKDIHQKLSTGFQSGCWLILYKQS